MITLILHSLNSHTPKQNMTSRALIRLPPSRACARHPLAMPSRLAVFQKAMQKKNPKQQ